MCVLAVTAAAGERAVLVDLDTGEPADGWKAGGLGLAETTVADGATPSGGRALTLVAQGERKNGRIGFARTATAITDWRSYRALSFHAKVAADAPVQMRVMGYRAPGPAALLKRFTLEPGDWREVVLPLSEFREDAIDQICDFSRIDVLLFRWDVTPGRVTVDDIALLPGDRGEASSLPTTAERLALAFPSGDGRAYESDDFLLLTNAPKLDDESAQKLLARCAEGLAVLRDVYRVDGEMGDPAPLLVFATRDEYVAYHERLGKRYRIGISRPRAAGLSVLGRATSSWSDDFGWDRPTFVHEAMHAALHRLLGVTTATNWLQESLANGVQVRLYPDSASSVDFAGAFEQFAEREGMFLPFDELFARKDAPSSYYAQYLTIAEFLADRHRDALPRVWAGVRKMSGRVHEKAPATIAWSLERDPARLEAEWAAWGLEHYGQGTNRSGDR